MKCDLCEKDFGENKMNYDRHMGSKEHLSRLYDKPSAVPIARDGGVVGGGGGGGTTTPHAGSVAVAPLTKNIPGVGDVVQKPDGTFITADALQVSQQQLPLTVVPGKPIPWKKLAAAGGAILLFIAVVWSVQRRKHDSPGAAAMPVEMPGSIESLIPKPLLGLAGLLLLSKMLRGELKSWEKLISDFAK